MIQVIRKPGAQFKRRKGAVKVLLLARVLVHMTTTPRSSRGLKGQARTYTYRAGIRDRGTHNYTGINTRMRSGDTLKDQETAPAWLLPGV